MSMSSLSTMADSYLTDVAAAKMTNLRQTLESIHSQSNSLLSFSLQWKDLEEYFTTISDVIVTRMEETERKSQQVEWKRKYIAKKTTMIELKAKRFKEREKRFEVELERLRKYKRRLKKKEMELEARELGIDVMARVRVCDDAEVKIGPLGECDGDVVLVDPSYADIKMNVTMDGRALQMFLNGRVNDHEALRGEVITGLRLSSDPAKLVLDAILGFYPEELENGNAGFDLDVVRKSCVLLLEELGKMKPRIKTVVRDRAMRVATLWKGKMNVNDVDHYLEVVGFLWLVATFGLTYRFDKDELLLLFEGCACHNRSPELCRNLGLKDDIHGVIQNLITKDQPFEAMRLIYAFELLDMFPPAPILEAHLSSTTAHAEQLYKGNPSTEAEIKCISMKLASLVSVVQSIKEYDLGHNYPVQPLTDLISELKIQKRKCKATIYATVAQENTDTTEKLCITSASAPESTSLPVSQICSEPTCLLNSPHSTEPLTPTISDQNCVSPSVASTMTSLESAVSPEEHDITSEVGSPSIPKVHPQNTTQQNKRPRLAPDGASGRILEPLNPHFPPYASRPAQMFSTRTHKDYYVQQRYYYPYF